MRGGEEAWRRCKGLLSRRDRVVGADAVGVDLRLHRPQGGHTRRCRKGFGYALAVWPAVCAVGVTAVGGRSHLWMEHYALTRSPLSHEWTAPAPDWRS